MRARNMHEILQAHFLMSTSSLGCTNERSIRIRICRQSLCRMTPYCEQLSGSCQEPAYHENLELNVGAEGWDEDRAAVAVVAGVVDVLQSGGEIDAAPHVDGVVRLQNIFAAVGEVA